jgi:hypothetical protein
LPRRGASWGFEGFGQVASRPAYFERRNEDMEITKDEGRSLLFASRKPRRESVSIDCGDGKTVDVDVVELRLGEAEDLRERFPFATDGASAKGQNRKAVAAWIIATARRPGTDEPYFGTADEESILAQPASGWPPRVFAAALRVNARDIEGARKDFEPAQVGA